MSATTTKPTVLVSGAGIAGATLAYWLDRGGFTTTVIERSPALRDSGQNVDVRGTGREVLRRMGLEIGPAPGARARSACVSSTTPDVRLRSFRPATPRRVRA